MMRYKIFIIAWTVLWVLTGVNFAEESQPSFGTQAGAKAQELKGAAEQHYETGAAKVKEAEEMVKKKTQDVFETLQEQYTFFSKQLQSSTQQWSRQAQKQWDDFQKSFNQPRK